MHINSTVLEAVRKGFKASFMGGLSKATSQYERIATVVPSTTSEETYGWLGEIPSMREWIGDRYIHGLAEHGYSIKNKDFELTVSVDRNKIKDDNIGVYKPMFDGLGRKTKIHPDQLCFGLLKNGFNQPCFDGQNFFDTDHPVIGEDGEMTTVSNFADGAGPAWYLLSTTEVVLPIIYQEREKPEFVALDNPQNPEVFKNKKFVYGVDGRCNVGFGFWQTAFASKLPLTAANYEAARVAMTSLKADHGDPLGVTPNLLLVPPQYEGAANKLMKNDQIDGSDNEWKGTAEVLMSPWLA